MNSSRNDYQIVNFNWNWLLNTLPYMKATVDYDLFVGYDGYEISRVSTVLEWGKTREASGYIFHNSAWGRYPSHVTQIAVVEGCLKWIPEAG